METYDLPTRLRKEPLVDALFEIRFSSSIPASNILPAMFVSGLESIERLPAAELPSKIRGNDPNLKFQPLIRVNWKGFIILIGDNVVLVACTLPYPGWKNFQNAILEAIQEIAKAPITLEISRCSLKYVDLIEGEDQNELVSRLNIDLKVGHHTLKSEIFSIRLEIPDNDILHAVSIAAPAIARTNSGQEFKGVMIDVDSIHHLPNLNFEDFTAILSDRLKTLHQRNKAMFFECLTNETIKYLEPEYE